MVHGRWWFGRPAPGRGRSGAGGPGLGRGRPEGGRMPFGIGGDVHSFGDPDEVRVKHADLDLTVDFDRKEFRGNGDPPVRASSRAPGRRPARPRLPKGLAIEDVEFAGAGKAGPRPHSEVGAGRPDPRRAVAIRAPEGRPGPDPLPDLARRRGLAMARPGEDGGREAAVPVHPVGGDPGADLDPDPGLAGRPGHLRGDDPRPRGLTAVMAADPARRRPTASSSSR